MRTRRHKSKTKKRKTRIRKIRGGSEFLQEAIQIAKEAAAMDQDHVFALAGSTAVHLYLTELLHHAFAEKKEGERLLETLAIPDDLDFKYKRYGPLFAKYIIEKPRNAPKSTGLTLNLSAFLEESNLESCRSYVDLAGFRSCDPYEESPIFQKLPHTTSSFSKLEFHAPREFRRRPMEIVELAGIPVLGLEDMIRLYESHQVAANSPKLAALYFVRSMYQKYPTFYPYSNSSSEM